MEIQVNNSNKERYNGAQRLASTLSCSVYRMNNGILKKFRNDSYATIFDHVVREIIILRSVSHPNIIRLKEIWNDHSHPCLILEDWGMSLWSYAAKMTRVERVGVFAPIFAQVLHAFNYLHTNRIIHCDVKATNLLIKNGIVKVCDFGLARRMLGDDLGLLAYTMNYRPPEILVGNCNYGTQADMWAIGCVMYDFITHTMLFGKNTDDETDDEVMQSILLEVPTSIEELEKINADYDIPNGPKWMKINQLSILLPEDKLNMIKLLLSIHPRRRPKAKDCLLVFGEEPQNVQLIQSQYLVRKKIKSDLNIRYIMVSHIIEIGNQFPISPFVISSAIDIYDKFLNTNQDADQTKLILYYIAAVILSSCINDSHKLFPSDFESVYNEKDITNAVKSLYHDLSYDLDSVSLWQIVQDQIALGVLDKTKEDVYWEKIKEIYLDYDMLGPDQTQVTQKMLLKCLI